MIGKCVSHYRIVEQLDDGGMGVVFKAEDLLLDRAVALKFLPSGLNDEEEAKERFIHEAKTASALDHPNICTIYEIGETEEGQLFIAMAYYEGETLHRKMARGPLGVAEAVGYVEQLAAGLAESHGRDIVHRDVKPANIFVTVDGQVKILDFGLAKMLSEGAVTLSGLARGTPAYMAPERVRGEPANPGTDLWSLGVVLYEALAGRRPFAGDNVAALIMAVRRDEPEDLRTLRPEVPDRLALIVQKLLQKDPEARFTSCAALLRGLEELEKPESTRQGSGADLGPPAQPAAAARLPAATGKTATGKTATGKTATGKTATGMAVSIAVLLLVTAVALLVLSLGRGPEDGAATLGAGVPKLAILPFGNRSGDPSLEWMATTVPALLTTDLSRSSRMRVLSDEEISRFLSRREESGGADGPSERARLLARQAHVDLVLSGAVVKAGGVPSLEVELHEAASGRELFATRVEVPRRDHVFSRVDEISLGILKRLGLAEARREPRL